MVDNIQKAFDLINYNGNKIDFYKEFKDYLKIIPCDLNSLNYWSVVVSNSLYQISNSSAVKSRSVKSIRLSPKRLRDTLKDFIAKFNEKSKKKQLGGLRVIKTDGKKGLFVYLSIINPSNTQLKFSTKPNKRNIGMYFCLYFSKGENKIYYFRCPDYLFSLINSLFMSKLKIRFDDFQYKEAKIEKLEQFLENEEVKIFEMAFRHSEVGISDRIVIKSQKGQAKYYYEKFKQSKIFGELSLYDLEYLRFSFQQGRVLRLHFKRKKGGHYIVPTLLGSPIKEDIPKNLKDFLSEGSILFEKVNEKDFIKKCIHKQIIDLVDYSNPSIRKIINNLEEINLLSINKHYKYYCDNPRCPYSSYRRATERRKCKCGNLSNTKYVAFYDLEINYNKIISLIIYGIKKENFGSCKVMPKKYLGFKNSSIIRIEKDKEFSYIILNQKGLSDEDIKNLKLLGLPFIIVSLKGEIKSTLDGFNEVDSGELIFSILNEDYSIFTKFLDEIKQKSHKLRLNAFETSLNILKSNKKISPLQFERCIFSIFNHIFLECQRWGGPSVADGSFPLRVKDVEYILWDAKRYDSSSLLEYLRQNSMKKDVKYLEKFNENKLIRSFGSVKYYLFATSNTSKEEFISAKNFLQGQIRVKRRKKFRKVEIVCINKDHLVKLGEFVNNHFDILSRKYDELLSVFKKGLKMNEGYFDFNLIEEEMKNLVKINQIYPSVSELRSKN